MMGLREYARHRASKGLPGATLRAVQVAIESGRLTVTRDRKIRDATEADAEWAASTAADKVPLTGPTAPVVAETRVSNGLAEARTRREAAQAELREMEAKQRRGELVPAKAIEQRISNVFAQCRAKLLGIPAKARQRDATLNAKQLALLDALIREALEDLADSSTGDGERRAS